MKRSTLTATLAATVAALAVTGCTAEAPSKSSDPVSGTNAPSEGSADAGADAEAVAEVDDEADTAEETSETLGFGETATYSNGLSISVSEPTEFTPSEWAVEDAPADNYLKFTVKVVNKTGANFDPSGMYLTMQSGNAEAEEIFDTDSGLEGTPMTTILNGRESTFDVGFGVDDPSDLVLEVDSGDFDLASSIFTTSE